jgi:hypothetical protein
LLVSEVTSAASQYTRLSLSTPDVINSRELHLQLAAIPSRSCASGTFALEPFRRLAIAPSAIAREFKRGVANDHSAVVPKDASLLTRLTGLSDRTCVPPRHSRIPTLRPRARHGRGYAGDAHSVFELAVSSESPARGLKASLVAHVDAPPGPGRSVRAPRWR